MPNTSPQLHRVTVIAENRETLDGLHGYFSSAGVASRTTRTLFDRVPSHDATTAIVLFPDEFEAKEVVSSIAALRGARPGLLVVVVTSTPQRYRSALEPNGRSRLPVVLSKPAFGWTILDSIRANATSAGS